MVRTYSNVGEAEAVCGAGYASAGATGRKRVMVTAAGWDTRVGGIDLSISSHSPGSYFPDGGLRTGRTL